MATLFRLYFTKSDRTIERDLRDKSEIGEDPKKVWEGSLDCSQISQKSDIMDDIFIKSLNSPDCCKCLKNLECKMRKISVLRKQHQVRLMVGRSCQI